MSKSNLHALSQPEATTNDPLHDLIRQGARDLIARAVESELQGQCMRAIANLAVTPEYRTNLLQARVNRTNKVGSNK